MSKKPPPTQQDNTPPDMPCMTGCLILAELGEHRGKIQFARLCNDLEKAGKTPDEIQSALERLGSLGLVSLTVEPFVVREGCQ
jgi:hypothetical protein